MVVMERVGSTTARLRQHRAEESSEPDQDPADDNDAEDREAEPLQA
jgi:hypothetical protein